MELIGNLQAGFSSAFSAVNLLYCFIGVFLGTFIGVLPGIGPLAAVSMLLPITFYLEPAAALVMLAGVYYGAEYGGSTTSILLNLPGTASNAVTCLDGYPMAKNGDAGKALFITTIASFVGGTAGILVMIALSPLLLAFTLSFGPAEYFAVMLLGLLAASTISSGAPIKGVAMVVVGLLLGTVGVDVSTGQVRYSFGILEFYDGISIVTLALGLFGVSEVIAAANKPRPPQLGTRISLRSMLPTWGEMRSTIMPMVRGSSIGSILGPLPGAGAVTASFLSYAFEKRMAKDPSRFGKGAIEGLACPESSNNAAVQTAFIPTLTLGIPGTPSLALMLGALMIHGIQPGPSLMQDHAPVFWTLVASFWIGNVLLLVLNIPLIGIWVRMLQIPYKFLYPAVVCLICTGVFVVSGSVFDIFLILVFGFVGYFMRVFGYEPAPLIIGFILGPMMEENLRRGLLMSRGSVVNMFSTPLSLGLLAVTAILLIWIVGKSIQRRHANRSVAV